MTSLEIPTAGSAEVHVLHDGYVGLNGDGDGVSGTVTLIRDGEAVIIVDPGMVADRDALLAALKAHGPAPQDVTDVVFSRHHPDHTINAALWSAAGPEEDPFGADQASLVASRKLLLEFADVIIPGDGAPFRPGTSA